LSVARWPRHGFVVGCALVAQLLRHKVATYGATRGFLPVTGKSRFLLFGLS
jgi:hypothetical protein